MARITDSDIGTALREAREAAGISQRRLAEQLPFDQSRLSRIETGERLPTINEVTAILTVLDVSDETRDRIMELAASDPDTSVPAWTAVGKPEVKVQIEALLNIEQSTTEIVEFAPLTIPGLLQTADVARAVLTASGTPPKEIATGVAMRVGRREILTRRNEPTKYTVFLGEPALRTLIGGPEVMADQLEFLVAMMKPNVEIRVYENALDWHFGLNGPAKVLKRKNKSTVVFLENGLSGLFLQEKEVVAAHLAAAEQMRQISMGAEQSAEFIGKVARQVRKE